MWHPRLDLQPTVGSARAPRQKVVVHADGVRLREVAARASAAHAGGQPGRLSCLVRELKNRPTLDDAPIHGRECHSAQAVLMRLEVQHVVAVREGLRAEALVLVAEARAPNVCIHIK